MLRRRHGGRLRDLRRRRVTALRLVKDAAELERIRRAAQVTDEALAAVVARGLVGRTEGDVAWQIEEELHRRGAEGAAFPPIVAAGARGAMPHAVPGREARDRPGQLVVIDTGARVDGYCSDITRTFAAGEIGGRAARAVRARAARAARRPRGRARRRRRQGRRRRRPGGHRRRPVTASASATAPVTASGSRSTRPRGLGRLHGDPLAAGHGGARSSRASTSRVSPGCASRTPSS